MTARKVLNGPGRWRRAHVKRPKELLDPHQLMEALELQDDPEYFGSLKEWVLYSAYKFLNMERSVKRQNNRQWAKFKWCVQRRFCFLVDYQESWPINNLIEPHLIDAYDPQREERVRRIRSGDWPPPPNPPVRTKRGKLPKKKVAREETAILAATLPRTRCPVSQNRNTSSGSRSTDHGPPSGRMAEVVSPRRFDSPAQGSERPALRRPPNVWVEVPPRSL